MFGKKIKKIGNVDGLDKLFKLLGAPIKIPKVTLPCGLVVEAIAGKECPPEVAIALAGYSHVSNCPKCKEEGLESLYLELAESYMGV